MPLQKLGLLASVRGPDSNETQTKRLHALHHHRGLACYGHLDGSGGHR